MAFAETAKEAWSRPRGVTACARFLTRKGYLKVAAARYSPSHDDFVRCLYGHAVFPDTANRLKHLLKSLQNEGDFIDTKQLLGMLGSKDKITGKFFHLSFDDGFANVIEYGGEIFEAMGVPYTAFIATDLIGAAEYDIESYFKSMRAYKRPIRTATWEQVRAVAESAMGEIGCHTRSHARLSSISTDKEALTREILGAKTRIEEVTKTPCVAFAWPYGTLKDIDQTSLKAIQDAGFEICFSAIRGAVDPRTTDCFAVPRHQVEFHWPLSELMLWALGYKEVS